MLKMYLQRAEAGGTPEFWDDAWAAGLVSSLSNRAICENDPLLPLFLQHMKKDRLFLEGGCGQAQWVKYFTELGYRAVGIDFAAKTIARVKQLEPGLDVRVGDVTGFDLADGEVHTYFSGGVVEHFESGPMPALVEARRVIAKDGAFLCSIPDHSYLRDRMFRRAQTDRTFVDPAMVVRRVDGTHEESAPHGTSFFQYVFSESEFRKMLEDAGFVVEQTFGYSVLWGLRELLAVQLLERGAHKARAMLHRNGTSNGNGAPASGHAPAVGAATAPSTGSVLKQLFTRALVREDVSTPLIGRLVGVMKDTCANLRMFVARPR